MIKYFLASFLVLITEKATASGDDDFTLKTPSTASMTKLSESIEEDLFKKLPGDAFEVTKILKDLLADESCEVPILDEKLAFAIRQIFSFSANTLTDLNALHRKLKNSPEFPAQLAILDSFTFWPYKTKLTIF